MPFSHWIKSVVICLTISGLAGCAVHNRADIAPPKERYEEFAPIGAPADARAFGDVSGVDSNTVVRDLQAGLTRNARRDGVQVLALSGGGADGAYGAGVLNGWTKAGNRPEFDIVTGVSTGAIIAPLAFLGPEHDAALQRFYTTTNTRKLVQSRVVNAILDGGSLARSTPLAQAIKRELNDDVLRKIAAEHAKGRRLLIGTTYLDAERPMIWDLGEIASQNTPQAFDLARKVILASASIPVYFNPVSIPVTDGTSLREELHVDGALTQQIFTYPVDLPMRRILHQLGLSGRQNTIWLIYNKRLEPVYQAQPTTLIGMTERTISTLIRTQGLGDLAFILSLAERDGFAVNAIAVPADFDAPRREDFDPTYMGKLFARGFADGAAQQSWYRNIHAQFFSTGL